MAVKLSSKKAPQKALLKAQDDLCAQMVSTAGRTASGRHRQPTEKETYRILKSQTNPEVFDNEPTELLSDIDRDEDNMCKQDASSSIGLKDKIFSCIDSKDKSFWACGDCW
ncbi:hypothetical protein BDR07DRAFT_1383210 [Suillus spraguei]|nr:hypothetical protein BDR07DRAFT_1383210 [Suillus spraguei]